MPIFGKVTYIEITPPRGICKLCDKNPTTSQTLSWYDGNAKQTKFFCEYLVFSLVHSTLEDVGIKENTSPDIVQRILDKYVKTSVNWKTIKAIGNLGIDEISMKKGHQDYVTLITSRVNGKVTILAVLKGREKTIIKGFLLSIPKSLVKTIRSVCCDLYEGYINAAKEVFEEKIPVIADRYHVAKLYRKGVTTLRKKELERLRNELSEDECKSLKLPISILVKKKECYSEDDKKILAPSFQHSPEIKSAYHYCRKLTGLFNGNHRKKTALKKLNQWAADVRQSNLKCFNKFIKTIDNHGEEIANYFIKRNNSGFVEGFNNKAKVLKRRCYGIYNLQHFFQRIFLDFEGYDLFGNNQSLIDVC